MKKQKGEIFSKFFGEAKKSRKDTLIDKCKKHDVSIYIDDTSETSSGIYAELRAIASEAELERRLNSKLAIATSSRANTIAIFALLISIISLAIALPY